MVLAVPSREGLDVARTRIRDYLGWEEVQSQLKGQDVDLIRQETLNANLDAAKKKVPEAVQQSYNIVVTVSDGNEVQAFKMALETTRPLFDQIKSDARSRIQETAVSYEALLPEGPYDLWRSGETSRRVKDLVGAFAQFPHLPKMLNRQAILDTLIEGCREGQFVLRLTRPDRSIRTIWRQQPDEGGPEEYHDGGRAPRVRRTVPHRAEPARPGDTARFVEGDGHRGRRREGLLLGRQGHQDRPSGLRRARDDPQGAAGGRGRRDRLGGQGRQALAHARPDEPVVGGDSRRSPERRGTVAGPARAHPRD